MTTKQGFWIGLAMGLCFAVGWAAALASVSPARAQSGRRFEYMTVGHGFDGGRWANEAGAQGWRFVGFDGGNSHMLIFERER